VIIVADEPKGLVTKLWRASLTILGATLALWWSVRLLLEIWWALAIIAGLIAGAAGLAHWWQRRSW